MIAAQRLPALCYSESTFCQTQWLTMAILDKTENDADDGSSGLPRRLPME